MPSARINNKILVIKDDKGETLYAEYIPTSCRVDTPFTIEQYDLKDANKFSGMPLPSEGGKIIKNGIYRYQDKNIMSMEEHNFLGTIDPKKWKLDPTIGGTI